MSYSTSISATELAQATAAAPALRIGAPLIGEPQPKLQWIEVASFLQIPGFQIIGLPSPEVAEARERVRAAIGASDLEFPRRRVILNLSPASIRKRGTGADLAMALAVLWDTYGNPRMGAGSYVAWGELGLDGTLKAAGQITCALYAAWEAGADALLVADEEYGLAQERLATLKLSGLIRGTKPPRIVAFRNLREAWAFMKKASRNLALPGTEWIPPVETLADRPKHAALLALPRSLERLIGIAASGAHHILLLGPRGTGKSHALEWLIALQPEPSAATRVQQTLLEELGSSQRSSTGLLPVRRVSPQARPAALIGTAAEWGIRPGEFSLAHGGLLLADELPEWSRDSREALREPLERGRVTLTRARKSVELPARFQFAANGNLCPCGGWPPNLPLPMPSPENQTPVIPSCTCPARARGLYLARLSGPVLDRLDLVVHTAQAELPSDAASAGERLAALSDQVARARARAITNWGCLSTELSAPDLESLLAENRPWSEQLASSRISSLRTRHKILRVALSLAAWDDLPGPLIANFFEATCYRPERFFGLKS